MTEVVRPAVRPARPFFSSGPCAKRPGWTPEALKGALVGRSHRSKPGKAKLKDAIERTRALLGIPADYRIGIVLASDTGSNPTDDGNADVLEDQADDPVREELVAAIRGLDEDARAELVALAWLGRGTFEIGEWKEAVSTARSEHSRRTAEYLLGLPLLGDYLEDGLAMFDEGIVDDADTREGLDSEDEPLGNMTDKPSRQ